MGTTYEGVAILPAGAVGVRRRDARRDAGLDGPPRTPHVASPDTAAPRAAARRHPHDPLVPTAIFPTTTPVPRADAPAEALAAVRALLMQASYDEATVARRLGAQRLFSFPRLRHGRTTLAGPIVDANAALVRVFMDDESLPIAQLRALWGEAALDAMRIIGMVTADEQDPDCLRSTAFIVPLDGLWMASDRSPLGARPDPAREPPDFVFPAGNQLTYDYLQVLDAAAGHRVLELCAGSGIAALRAMRQGATDAWATDIAQRSVDYARFNACLNDLHAMRALVSDGWQGLGDETFDRVYAHPPYVPALSHTFDYRDAGADGEQVTRAIVEGLPAHLRPGGRAFITCAMSDRRDEPAQARMLRWLGAHAGDFELVMLQRSEWDTMHAYRTVAGDGAARFVDLERWMQQFDSLGIERFVLASFELRRERRVQVPVVERKRVADPVTDAVADWRFRWAHHLAGGPDAQTRLAGARPRVVPGARLEIGLRADADRDWRTVGSAAMADWPGAALVRMPPAGPTLLELCDGTRDVLAVHEALRAAEAVAADVTPVEIAQLIELLSGAGVLEIPSCPVPVRPPVPRAGAVDPPAAAQP